MLPRVETRVFKTPNGVPYLKAPGVALIGRTTCDLSGVESFLAGFDKELKFDEYLDDPADSLEPGAALSKFAGQLCYFSMGPKRTWNKDAQGYFDNILSSGHGSVVEHVNFTFLMYG